MYLLTSKRYKFCVLLRLRLWEWRKLIDFCNYLSVNPVHSQIFSRLFSVEFHVLFTKFSLLHWHFYCIIQCTCCFSFKRLLCFIGLLNYWNKSQALKYSFELINLTHQMCRSLWKSIWHGEGKFPTMSLSDPREAPPPPYLCNFFLFRAVFGKKIATWKVCVPFGVWQNLDPVLKVCVLENINKSLFKWECCWFLDLCNN